MGVAEDTQKPLDLRTGARGMSVYYNPTIPGGPGARSLEAPGLDPTIPGGPGARGMMLYRDPPGD